MTSFRSSFSSHITEKCTRQLHGIWFVKMKLMSLLFTRKTSMRLHNITEWFGLEGMENSPSFQPPALAGTCSPSAGCSKPRTACSACPQTLPGMGYPQLLVETSSSASPASQQRFFWYYLIMFTDVAVLAVQVNPYKSSRYWIHNSAHLQCPYMGNFIFH